MKKVVTGHGPSNTCYGCGTSISDWTGLDGAAPRPGDYSVCTTCCAVLVWSVEDGKFVEPSEAMKAEIQRYPDVRKIVSLIKRIGDAQNRGDGGGDGPDPDDPDNPDNQDDEQRGGTA